MGQYSKMTIITYEKNERGRSCADTLKTLRGVENYERIFVLPIPSLKDGGIISGSEKKIDELTEELEPGDLVAGYKIDERYKARIKDKGVDVVDCSQDEEFVLENARLTALATLGILLTGEKRTLSDMCVGVIGYGRIGKYLTEMLLYVGAEVCVFTSKKSTCIELCEAGVKAKMTSPDTNLSSFDILINTAPAKIFEIGKKEKAFPKIIDLATGECFAEGVAQKYPSLPAKMYPISAGRLYALSIERCIGAKNDRQSE